MLAEFNGIKVEVRLDGEVVEHAELFEATWRGRRAWPSKEEWIKTERFFIFNQ